MKKIIIIIVLTIGKIQAQYDCHIKDYWQNIFVLDTSMYSQKVHYYIDIKSLPETHKCAREINSHLRELKYIRTNFTNFRNIKGVLEQIHDSILRQRKLVNLLQKDTLFMHTITGLGDAWRHTYPKDTVSMDILMDIAAHFFYLDKQLSDGSLGGHVCGGINALNSLQTDRKPLIETFVFKTLYDNYTGNTGNGKYNMYDEYVKAVKEIYKIDFGKIDERRLILAQGAMMMYMFQNKALKSLLSDAYEKQKGELSFILKDYGINMKEP